MRFISLFAPLLIAGALTLPASAQQRIPVTIATVPSASAYLALGKGYFRDAGLDVAPPHPYNSID